MYHLVYAVIYVFSLLPLRVLYIFSDLIYVLVYRFLKYRKDIVRNNLKIAFPHKSESEIERIEKQFYRNLMDTMIETIKLFSAGERFLNKRVKADMSFFDRFYFEKQKIQVHLGHNFNWEIFNLYGGIHAKQKLIGVYMPLKSSLADRLFLKMRSKFGTVLVPATKMRAGLLPHRNNAYILGLIADQTPAHPDNAYWVNFFGRPTAFLRGPEKGARAANLPVVFCHSTSSKRGYYQLHFQMLAERPAELKEGELTTRYAAMLEQTISHHPEMWLWSHRRWKHEWKPDYKIYA